MSNSLFKNYAELYRHYDENDNLLYVGVSHNAMNRYKRQHKLKAEWARYTVKMTIERFERRCDALAAEAKAIAEEKPAYNAADGRGNDRWVGSDARGE